MVNKKALSLIAAGTLLAGGVGHAAFKMTEKVIEQENILSDYRKVNNKISQIENLSQQELYKSLEDNDFVEDYRNLLKKKIEYDANPKIKKSLNRSNIYTGLGFVYTATTMGAFLPIFGGIGLLRKERRNKKISKKK